MYDTNDIYAINKVFVENVKKQRVPTPQDNYNRVHVLNEAIGNRKFIEMVPDDLSGVKITDRGSLEDLLSTAALNDQAKDTINKNPDKSILFYTAENMYYIIYNASDLNNIREFVKRMKGGDMHMSEFSKIGLFVDLNNVNVNEAIGNRKFIEMVPDDLSGVKITDRGPLEDLLDTAALNDQAKDTINKNPDKSILFYTEDNMYYIIYNASDLNNIREFVKRMKSGDMHMSEFSKIGLFVDLN